MRGTGRIMADERSDRSDRSGDRSGDGSAGGAEGESAGGAISDEEWARFQREAEAGSEGAPAEPSARARMVARRLREEPSPPAGWRIHQPPPPPRGRRAWTVLGLLAAAVLLVLALAPGPLAGWFGGGSGDGGGGEDGNGPLAAESVRPATQLPTADQPFRGSPAVGWGDGTAGIKLPEARATGWMSKEQVARALTRSREFLTAAHLDPAVLRGERPARAIALINPHQRDVQEYLSTAFRAPSRGSDPLLLFSRFDPSEVRLVGDVVKARGGITFREGERGAVEVAADVTYVYPVVRAVAGGAQVAADAEVARTIVRREVVMSWDDPAKIRTEQGTFSLVSYKEHATNGGCDTFTGYFTPRFAGDAGKDAPSGPEVDPYDRSTSMDERMREGAKTECGTATRT